MSPGVGARAALLALLAVAVYAPSLEGGFLHDDEELLTANPVVRQGGRGFGAEAWAGLAELWLPPPDGITAHHLPGIPVTATTLWLEWRLFGPDARGYRAVNALLHALCALLLWRVLARMQVPGAWWAALFWALHPVCVESVAWIAERKNTLSMLFGLASAGAWLRWLDGGGRLVWWLALVAAAAALLAKPAVVPLPLVLLVLSLWWRGRFERGDARALVPFLALAVAAGVAAVAAQHGLALGDAAPDARGYVERALNASAALGFHAWKTLWPTGLAAVYPRWHETLPGALQALPGLALAGALAASWRTRDGWGRHALLALSGWALLLAPALGLVSMSYLRHALVADHFQYHALPFALAALVALAVHALAARLPDPALTVLGAAVAGALAWQTASYAVIFRDERTLWSHTLARNPEAWLAHSRLGALDLRAGEPARARAHLERAAALAPDDPAVHNNLGAALAALGEPRRALAHFERALALAPNDGLIQLSGALALLQSGRPAAALPHFDAALRTLRDAEARALAERGREEARRRAARRR